TIRRRSRTRPTVWLNPFPSIWREEPARIPIPGDAAVALARLKAKTARFLLSGLHEGFVGRVGRERVTIRSYGALEPLSREEWPYESPLSPSMYDSAHQLVLDARVTRLGEESALVGVYRKSQFVRIVYTVWLILGLSLLLGGAMWLVTGHAGDPGPGRGLLL